MYGVFLGLLFSTLNFGKKTEVKKHYRRSTQLICMWFWGFVTNESKI